MKNKDLGKRVKELRIRKGLSQEELAENSGLSLRTIQRIENGENEPRGDTLKRLSNSLNVSPDEITDWLVVENPGYLAGMNLSSLSFILFPLFGILIPLIMWISRKDKIKEINRVAKSIINFQITWAMLFFLIIIMLPMLVLGDAPAPPSENGINDSAIDLIIANFLIFALMYLYNIILIIINAVRSYRGKDVWYFPVISFIRK